MGSLSWRGRTKRLPFFLIVTACQASCLALGELADTLTDAQVDLALLWVLACFWIEGVTTARRARDAGWTPWIAPLVYVPVVGFALLVVLSLKRSSPIPG